MIYEKRLKIFYESLMFSFFPLFPNENLLFKFRNDFLHSADGIDIISLDAELKQLKSKSSQHILNLLMDSEFSLAHKVLLEIDTEIAGSYSGLVN